MTRWIVVLAVSLACASVARAAGGPDDQYLDIYNQILRADSSQQNGDPKDAAVEFINVQKALQKFKADYPTWNPEVIDFRLQYTSEQLAKLQPFLQTNAAAAVKTAPSSAPQPQAPAVSPDIAILREQIKELTDANTDLENRLKEALSVQPAAVSPDEVAKAQARIVELEKERDLLKVEVEKAKATPSAAAPASDNDTVRQLKKELAARQKEFSTLEKRSKRDLQEAHSALEEAQSQNADLQKKLDAALAAANAPRPAVVEAPRQDRQLDELRARLAVLEAEAVPYTPEELAILKGGQQHVASTNLPEPAVAATAPGTGATPSATPANAGTPMPAAAGTGTNSTAPTAAATKAAAPGKHIGHSKEDLPPGAGALMAEALRDVMERNFSAAEAKLREILHQDENNVYVLAYLANAQLAENHLAECDKTVQRALKLDPDDPASLYLLGVIRYQQQRYDDALAALSRSAQLNPTNSSTQNYLGCVLAEKGQRAAAETALRKALQVDPSNAEAHYNLAYVYATAVPPLPQLALWHYQRALAEGHPKSAALEKLLPHDTVEELK